MSSIVPGWADAELSASLPNIRSAGEGPKVEFKESIPEQAHKLAKEFAAFGTSGGGNVFVGVDDNGEYVGIDANDNDARDRIYEQIHGIILAVQPSLNAEILFAFESVRPVVVIRIGKQDQPVYYYQNTPYIRDKRRSRPATPDEVKECVWSHPSSEFKREQERQELENSQALVDMNKKFIEESAERRRRHSEEMSAQRRRLGGY